MPRPIWSGSISFGLVNVPVKLLTAVHQKEVRFHMLHDEDGARIKQKRVCSKDDEEVPYEHIAKGYEVSPGSYVMVTPDELEAFDPEATKAIEIEDFVGLQEIDPIYWDHTYHLVPNKGAEKAYALLFHAMKEAKKVGIARVVLRTKQYLCTIRPMEKGLVMSTMQYADEIVDQSDLEGLPKSEHKPKERELQMAGQLIDTLTTEFKPEKYKDEYRERVLELIHKKAEGEEIVAAPPEKAAPGKVVNLMEALKASLSHQERGERRAPVEHAKAARSRRAPKARKAKKA
jgi:DNA end-binding protein Ku